MVLTAWFGGFKPALGVTILATLALDYFFIAPLYQLEPDWRYLPTLLVFGSVAAAVSALVTARKNAEENVRVLNQELEHRVVERTAELAAANMALEREIEERRRAELELAGKAEELTRSNEELERFAYVASHDLRAPLATIKTSAQMIARQVSTPALCSSELLGFIQDSADRAIRLVSDLLRYSQLDGAEEFCVLDLNEIAQAAIVDLRDAIREAGASVTVDELPKALGNQTRLIQLFQNVIGNALKYRSRETPRVRIGSVSAGEESLIFVKDNGIGFEKQYAEVIFSLFKRLHGPENSGSGIGLATCKKIVVLHGGRIWAESSPGQGSIFWFTLPGLAAEAEAAKSYSRTRTNSATI